ncbi:MULTISPECIES: sialidase family protein [unclassified Crossiella]|uniref:sialidase family protein n=1 Tax=unclassified Crossiella TaxID=2620835 RepID=UPI001FFEC204|nr:MULTISPECIES: hypothetical protein [unclassified Crossiella]MCK2241415.1 hypothetical protein [Crossiella sp. S99.2]MCK2257033.1 hypothetical protein [Crossiella sp. S99.1]
MRTRPWRTRMTAALVSGALLTGALGAPPPALAAVPIDQNALANTLLGSYLRIVDGDREYARHLVATAELTDWRARNPQADQNALSTHLNGVQKAIEAVVPERVWDQQPHEVVAASLHALRGAAGAVTNGPRIVELAAKVVGRDAQVLTGRVTDRIANTVPHLGYNSGFDTAQAGVWSALGSTARADANFRGAWDKAIGSVIGVSAGQPATQLSQLPRLKQVLDIQPILDQTNNPAQLKLVSTEKFRLLTSQLYEQRKTGLGSIKADADAGVPGKKATEPDAKAKAAAEADEKKRQGIINGVKGAFDGLAWFIGLNDPEAGRQLRAFANGAVQIATAVNKCVTAFKLISSVFSMATLAFTGNVIGAISSIVSVFAGAGPSIEELIMEEIGKLREQVVKLHEDMVSHFQRIDQRLDVIYQGLTRQLHELSLGLDHMRGQVETVSQQLVDLSTKTQVIGTTVIESLANLSSSQTWQSANLIVDYKRLRPTKDVTFGMYETAENIFQDVGQLKAMQAPYVVPEGNYGVDDETARTNLANHGHTGVVRYLSAYAKAHFDGAFPVSAEMVNPMPWKLAANAYSLIAAQNPQHLGQILSVRPHAVAKEGARLRDAALQFSEPGPDGAVNKLFTGLTDRYTREIVDLYNHNAKTDFVVTKGNYSLWDGPQQPIDRIGDLAGEATVPRCDSGGNQRIKRPGIVDGAVLPPAQRFARAHLEPKPGYDACWTAAEWVNKRVEIVPVECGPPMERGCEYHWRFADLKVQFRQDIELPGFAGVSRWTAGVARKNVKYEVCVGKNGVVNPLSCDTRAKPHDLVAGEWDSMAAMFEGNATHYDPEFTERAAVTAMTEFLKRKQADYYRAVANDIRSTGSARKVNLTVDLLRAYTQLGLPRALETDDHLRALLYGRYALHTSVNDEPYGLAGNYDQAADNLSQGKPPWESDQHEASADGCQPLPGLVTRDPYAACIARSTKIRLDRLIARYTEQFKQRWEGTDQSLPEVQTTLRNLWLTVRTWHPDVKETLTVEPPAPLAPPVSRWSRPLTMDESAHGHGGPALLSFKGKRYAAWRGVDGEEHNIYLSSTVDGRTWSPKQLVGFAGTQGTGVSMTEFNGQLVLSWRVLPSRRPNLAKIAVSPDGVTWTLRNAPASMHGTAEPPALAAHGGKLWAVHQGEDHGMYLSSSPDAVTWTTHPRLYPARTTSHRPTLISFNGNLNLGWRDAENGRLQLSTSSDGSGWNAPYWVWGGGTAESGVALAVVKGKLFASWQNAGDRTLWGSESVDGAGWVKQREVARGNYTAREHALSEVDGRLLVTWQAADSPYLMSSVSGVL